MIEENKLRNMKEIDEILNKFNFISKNRFSSFGNKIRISALYDYMTQENSIKDNQISENNFKNNKLIGQIVKVGGWIRSTKLLQKGELLFLEVNDGSCVKHLQVILSNHMINFDILKNEGIGACVTIKGLLEKSQGSKQHVELVLNDNSLHQIEIIGKCDKYSYPLVKSRDKVKLDTLRNILHLRPRTNIIGCISRIRSNLAMATHHFFQSIEFLYINSPIITQLDCEATGEQFQVTTLLNDKNKSFQTSEDFFKTPVYLTTSGQLELEAFSAALSDVYSFGPTFRAELEQSERHLAEFWMVECEFSFSDLDDVISLSEKYIKFCLKYILSKNKEDLYYIENFYNKTKNLIKDIQEIIEKDFYKISYSKAIEILTEKSNKQKNLFRDSVTWGISLSPEHEKYLTDEVFKFPVFVYNYPQRIKSFYMRENPDNETVASVDLLVPKIGEIIGGSVQEERFEILKENIKKFFESMEKKEKCELFENYLDLRKYGTCPRSGFGVGFDRLVMFATGIDDIKDCIPYPRYSDYNEC